VRSGVESVCPSQDFQLERRRILPTQNARRSSPHVEKISKDSQPLLPSDMCPNETDDKRAIRSVKLIAEENGRKLAVKTRTSYSILPRPH